MISDRYPVTVNVEVDDDRQVLADPLRLEQMIGNLLSNAHKYGRPPFVLRLRPHLDARDLVCIDVDRRAGRRTGGVPGPAVPGVQPRLRLGRTGTGLGLHVVRSLAQAQGGSISYAPAASGGAVFTLPAGCLIPRKFGLQPVATRASPRKDIRMLAKRSHRLSPRPWRPIAGGRPLATTNRGRSRSTTDP